MQPIELPVKLKHTTHVLRNLMLFDPGDVKPQNIPPIPVMVVTHYSRPDYLLRCLESIDHPVEKLVIIQTGPNKWMPGIDRKHIHIKLPDGGFQAAINLGVKTFPAPWWMLVSNDIAFATGDLWKMAFAANSHSDRFCAFFGNHAMAFWIWTVRGINKVGLYDENYHPAYLEDTDWLYRRSLTDELICCVDNIHALHGNSDIPGKDPGSTMKVQELFELNKKTFIGNAAYYVKKWGDQCPNERYVTPFNKPLPIDYWKFDPEIRMHQHWEKVKP